MKITSKLVKFVSDTGISLSWELNRSGQQKPANVPETRMLFGNITITSSITNPEKTKGLSTKTT